jgi:hypothetical protein
MCSFQVSFLSICIPKYLTDGDSGSNMLLKKSGGHWFFRSANVTSVDLVSFIWIFHLFAHKIDKFIQ